MDKILIKCGEIQQMKFQIEGKRTVVTTVTVVESISGEIDITKKTVMAETGCEAKEDGDSTAWYSYVDDALNNGGNYKDGDLEIKVLEVTTKITTEFDEPPVVNW